MPQRSSPPGHLQSHECILFLHSPFALGPFPLFPRKSAPSLFPLAFLDFLWICTAQSSFLCCVFRTRTQAAQSQSAPLRFSCVSFLAQRSAPGHRVRAGKTGPPDQSGALSPFLHSFLSSANKHSPPGYPGPSGSLCRPSKKIVLVIVLKPGSALPGSLPPFLLCFSAEQSPPSDISL